MISCAVTEAHSLWTQTHRTEWVQCAQVVVTDVYQADSIYKNRQSFSLLIYLRTKHNLIYTTSGFKKDQNSNYLSLSKVPCLKPFRILITLFAFLNRSVLRK